jgi:AraC-like DNA-binding protein
MPTRRCGGVASGFRAPMVIFTGAVTRAAIQARVIDAHARGHRMAAIAQYLGVDRSTVSKMIKRHTGGVRLERGVRREEFTGV